MARVEFNLEEQVHRVVAAVQNSLLGMVRYDALVLSRICESPIEVALGGAILMLDRIDPFTRGHEIAIASSKEIPDYKAEKWLLVPQYEWQDFRIDLALRVPEYRFKWVFIECDGHDFHERTKEQAARDRQKDREIQASGIPVLRFTGSEIHRNLESCAEQVFQFIEDRFDDWVDAP
jgi:very-short-patch-repair endonuclease